jgi:hypothetical protein
MVLSGDLLADGWDEGKDEDEDFDPDVEIEDIEGSSHVTVTIGSGRRAREQVS